MQPLVQNIFVPVFLGLPIDENHLLPLLKIVGTTAIVSTLLGLILALTDAYIERNIPG